MTNKDYLKDISDIKNMMNKSSRFNSLSGISGIATGLYAIIGSLIAYQYVVKNNIEVNNLDNNTFYLLLADLILIILLSLITSFIITRRKTKEETRNGWSTLTKKMVYNFSIILIPSAIYILVLIMKNDFVNAGSLMLFFYGASLINASHHTFKEIKTLAIKYKEDKDIEIRKLHEELDNFKKTIEKSNSLYESMIDKTTDSLEKIISNTESLSKIQ